MDIIRNYQCDKYILLRQIERYIHCGRNIKHAQINKLTQ